MSPDLPAGPWTIGFLCFALVVCALSCLGVMVMKGVYNKLHYLAPPAVLGTAAIATAILLQEGVGAASVKSWLVFLVMVTGNPVITFAAARAHHLRLDKRKERSRARVAAQPKKPGGAAEEEDESVDKG